MPTDSALIDRIVHGVLEQLGGAGVVAPEAKPTMPKIANQSTTIAAEERGVEIGERIVTAEVLTQQVNGSGAVTVGPKALVTPAAWDLIRERGLTLKRKGAKPQTNVDGRASPAAMKSSAGLKPLLLVVRNTDVVDRLWADLNGTWRRELLGCPDDAARLAIAELSRGAASVVFILAEQAHRAACLANRNEAVKAVAVRDAADVPVVRKQLRANVWCVDPSGRSWFELRNLIKAINK